MTRGESWTLANQNLIAKSIGELCFEQIFHPRKIPDAAAGSDSMYRVDLESGVSYEFRGWQSLWQYFRIRPASVFRLHDGKREPAVEASQLFIDAQGEHGMTPIILGNFLEEMYSTLYSDMRILEKTSSYSATELTEMNGLEIQGLLNGHPKILLNKGRRGWGVRDLELYAPESSGRLQLHWLALAKEKAIAAFGADLGEERLNSQNLGEETLATFSRLLTKMNKNPQDYIYIPVHPWQWDQVLQIQFAGEIAREQIISLGFAGDRYQPQISLRTLSNVDHPEKPDVKLPLTILNTSAVRGLPGRYVAGSCRVSEALGRICSSDSLLRERNTVVLGDIAGVSFSHAAYAKIPEAPYRYHETLGVVWRESVAAKLQPGEKAILSGSLFHQDSRGRSLIGAYIEKSHLEVSTWLKRYFETVVIPLYHLQLRYGIGLVAHGQNILVKLKSFAPDGIFLKDFQGDLRISSKASETYEDFGALDRLPPEHLIHDLITGHLLTVLRFVSAVLQESDGFAERSFYDLLAESIREYRDRHQGGAIDPGVDLLHEKFHRILLNKVRFKIGYADLSQRPLPALGTELPNPLSEGETYA